MIAFVASCTNTVRRRQLTCGGACTPDRADLDDRRETLFVVWRRARRRALEAELPWMIGVARNVLRTPGAVLRRTNFESTLPNRRRASAERLRHRAIRACETRSFALNNDDREVLMLNAWDGLDHPRLGRRLT